jgi:putative phosphoesterase
MWRNPNDVLLGRRLKRGGDNIYVMLIGIMGDSHDNIEAIKAAVAYFNELSVEAVLHTGDIVSPFTIEYFKKLRSPFKAVVGNNEGDKVNLARKLEELDAELTDILELELAGKKIVVYHGQNPSLLDTLVKSRKYDLVATGHTHTPEVTMDENTLIVNPGETCGYLTGTRTVAIIDTEKMAADIHTLD